MTTRGMQHFFKRLTQWSRASSLRYFRVGFSCCADELFEASGCRYDLERFGVEPAHEPEQADLLIVSAAINAKTLESLKKLYDKMKDPKYVMAIGSCSSCGGIFREHEPQVVTGGIHPEIPVDVFVPGCPPRPEALMHGIVRLQEKIRGND